MKWKFKTKSLVYFFYKGASSWENLKVQMTLFHCSHLPKEMRLFFFFSKGQFVGYFYKESRLKFCLALPLLSIQASSQWHHHHHWGIRSL